MPGAGPRTVDWETRCLILSVKRWMCEIGVLSLSLSPRLTFRFISLSLLSLPRNWNPKLFFRLVLLSFPSSLTFPHRTQVPSRGRKIWGRMWKNLQFEPGKHMYVRRLLNLTIRPSFLFETQYDWLILNTFSTFSSSLPTHFLSFSSHHLSLFLTSCIH